MDERLADELECLKAILMDDVIINNDKNGPCEVQIAVLPATADDSSSQYVRVTLVAHLPTGYPDISPIITLKNPRGLDDSILQKIEFEIDEKLKNLCGEPVIFELIEVVREHLTASNLPSCPCVICLYGFNHDDDFIKTSCYHYFHSHCLWRHIVASERIFQEEQDKIPAWQRTNAFQRQCPVCRDVIDIDEIALSSAAPPVERETARNFELDENLVSLQKKMADLFRHQQSRGGIIDLEAEDTKLLLVTEPTEEAPGPSDHRQIRAAITAPRVEPRRGNSNARGNRGSFHSSRKNRGHHLSSASR